MERTPDQYRCHHFPGEIIGHAVWLYHTFSLSFRDATSSFSWPSGA
jgi:transposase-like protein